MSKNATRKRMAFQEPGFQKPLKRGLAFRNEENYSDTAAFNSRLAKRPDGDTVKDTFIYSQPDDSDGSSILSDNSDYTQSTIVSYSRTSKGVEDRLNRIERTVANLKQQLQELSVILELSLAKGPVPTSQSSQKP